jgi:hypothetical protein
LEYGYIFICFIAVNLNNLIGYFLAIIAVTASREAILFLEEIDKTFQGLVIDVHLWW